MKSWKRILHRVATNIESQFDYLWHRLEKHLDSGNPIIIQSYLGYGNHKQARLHGRVLYDNGIIQAKDRDTLWDNVLNTYRRFATREISLAVIKASLAGREVTTTANDEGYFTIELPIDDELLLGKSAEEIRLHVLLEVMSIPGMVLTAPFPQTVAQIVLPGTNAEYGIISDLDDTVIQSDVLNWMKLAKNIFIQNAHTRLPFAGVAAFYQALHQGTRRSQNPIYYVSSSPWNIHDLLTDFFTLRDIPQGPMFLQDIGFNEDQFYARSHAEHKLLAIKNILELQADLPFILIGDSTQHDPEIYYQVASTYPGRIKAIYIRDINRQDVRSHVVEQFAAKLAQHHIPMLLVKDTVQAAIHAAALNLILPETIPMIGDESTSDKSQPNVVEQLIEQTSPPTNTPEMVDKTSPIPS